MWSYLQPQRLQKQSRCVLHALAQANLKGHTACWDTSTTVEVWGAQERA